MLTRMIADTILYDIKYYAMAKTIILVRDIRLKLYIGIRVYKNFRNLFIVKHRTQHCERFSYRF